MCHGTWFPAWQAEAIRSLRAVDGVAAGLLIVREAPPQGRREKLRRLGDLPHLLWTLFNKGYVERRSTASKPVDMGVELGDVPKIRCRTEPVGRYGERFTDEDVATVRDHDLDFVLRFAFGIIKGEILETPRHGVWSFHHGDERVFRGRPPGFWELVEGEAVVGSILQRLTERLDGGVVLHRGFFKATPHSYLRTRDEAFLGSADWASVVARTIAAGDTAIVTAPPSTTDAPVRRDPTNGVMARFLVSQAVAFLRSQWEGLTRAAKWSVGVADAPIGELLHGAMPPIRWLPEHGRSRYLADPFAVDRGGSLVSLVEDYDYRTHRGVISVVPLDDVRPPKTVIDAGVHASYPYLFAAEGDMWCMPETYQAGEVRLYRAVDFPTAWEHVATPLSGMAALDATVVAHDGRWWLFCTDHASGPNTKLRIWHAPALTGPWEPHPLNPVKTDVRSSRPAGTPFVVDGVLYRPAQDGSVSYGGSITINRVDVLTPDAFSEEAVARVTPPAEGRYRDGIHTLCAVGDRTVVDGRRDTFVAAAFRRELASRWKKLLGGRSQGPS